MDVYLADFKYASALEAGKLSHAPRYPEIALAAIEEMVAQVPVWEEDDEGLLLKGVIVRHLVLPGRVEESKRALATLHDRFGSGVRLSIMSQYTPLASGLERYGLAGRVTEEEYEEVLDYADSAWGRSLFFGSRAMLLRKASFPISMVKVCGSCS